MANTRVALARPAIPAGARVIDINADLRRTGPDSTEMAKLKTKLSVPLTNLEYIAFAGFYSILKAAGVLAACDGILAFVRNETDALLNLANLDGALATKSGSPTFTATGGYSASASPTDAVDLGYIESGFNPATATGAKTTQNSAHFALVGTDGVPNGAAGGGNLNLFIQPAVLASGSAFIRGNSTTSSQFSYGSSPIGLVISNRRDALAQLGYTDGVETSFPVASLPLISATLQACRRSGAATPYCRQRIGMMTWGSGLTLDQCKALDKATAHLFGVLGQDGFTPPGAA